MRNFLLAATAIAALAGASSAYAQTGPVTEGRASWVGAPFTAGPPSNGEDPGTIKAYFRGRLWVDAGLVGDSGDSVAGSKSQPQFVGEFARIYPSFDGTTANGLKYGAFLEVRQNGAGSSAAGSNGPSGTTTQNTLFFRREQGYVGGNWGALRFGATDGPLGLFMVGTFENFDLGGSWNGDLPDFTNAAVNVTWTPPENSGDYGDSKIVYVSPSFGGFDFGFSYEPNASGGGEVNQSYSQAGSIRLSSIGGGTFAANTSSLQREKNTVQFGGRYQGTIGPVGVQLEAVGFTAGTVGNNGLTGLTAGGAPQYKFKTPWAVDMGGIVNFGGLSVGGNIWTGAVNPNGSRNTLPVVSGGINTFDYVVGASYAFGSYIVGANMISTTRQGNNWQDLQATAAGIGKMHELGIDVGGTYAWGPGAAASLSYYYGERHQPGVNLYTSAASRTGNNTHANGVILTQFFSW
jgi:hypothetical protein